MQILFIGTKAFVEESSKYHKNHTSTLVSYKNTKILVDCGLDWQNQLDQLKKYKPDAILITHAHPDHAYGLKNGAFAPIYASKDTINLIKDFNIEKDLKNIIKENQTIKIKNMEVTLYPNEHSIRCPASSYKIKGGEKTIFYSGDIAYLPNKEKILIGLSLYIGDGSSIKKSLIRKKNDKIFGHASIQTQLTWCQKADLKRAIFTHCGKEIIKMGYKNANSEVKKLGLTKGVNSQIAFDGLKIKA